MEFFNKFLCIVLLMCFMTRGTLQCSPSDLTVSQVQSVVKTVWKVTVGNECKCTFLHVTLRCPGFDPVKNKSKSISKIDGNLCLVDNGNPIYGGTTFEFTYTSDREIQFAPDDFLEACS